MITSYEIIIATDSVSVFEIDHKGTHRCAAHVSKDFSVKEIAQEFYEIIASAVPIPIEVIDLESK